MSILKQKRNKKGQYQSKRKYLTLHLFLLAATVWTVNTIDYQNLEPERWVIAQTNNNYPVRLDVSNTPNSALSTTTVGTDDGRVVATVEEAHPSSLVDKIKQAFPEEPEIAVAIAMCESRLNPLAEGDTHMEYHSFGLYQINQTWHKYSKETLTNPDENIRIAKEIRNRWGNWNAWSCYKYQYYQKYL